jgi:hypothetical protein
MLTLASSTGSAIAMATFGVVAVLAVCAVFYAIGRGEDRDRAVVAPGQAPAEPPADDATTPSASPERPRSPGRARRRRP